MNMKVEAIKPYEGLLKKVHLTRPFPSARWTKGFVHWATSDVIVLQQYHDFYSEGYCILRAKDVMSIRSDAHAKFLARMFDGEGLHKYVNTPLIPKADTMSDFVKYFQDTGANVIIECEAKSERDALFACGKIIDIDGNEVKVKKFNADEPCTPWNESEASIPLDRITKIQFNTPYANIFSNQLPDCMQG